VALPSRRAPLRRVPQLPSFGNCGFTHRYPTPARLWLVPALSGVEDGAFVVINEDAHSSPPRRAWTGHLSLVSARPRDSWVICGSALGLIEKAVEFAAGRIEGALLLFRAVVDQWAAVGPNRITNKFLGRDLS